MTAKPPIYISFGWLKYIIYTVFACFFLAFGVQVLFFAYELNDPFSFIMTFFASNLIILISAALMIVFVFRLKNILQKVDPEDEESDDNQSGAR